MTVVINLQCAQRQKTGVGHYAAELARHLEAVAEPGEVVAFPSRWRFLHRLISRYIDAIEPGIRARKDQVLASRPDSRRPLLPWLAWKVRSLRLRDQARLALFVPGRLWMQRQLRAALDPRRCSLYHEPNHIPVPADVPTLVTIHDLSALLHPEWHPADRLKDYEKHFREGVARSQHFLTDTHCVRQELIRHLGVRPERVTCIPIGVRPELRPLPPEKVRESLRALGLPPRYLLHLGTIEPRKNVLTLLRAYCDLPADVRERCPLVLVGGWGWKTEEVSRFFHEQARHRGVLHLGYVPDEHVAAVYNGARALVFPSHYEGFGLPPVEMMACGGAVISSLAESVVETVGSRAHLVEADDLAGWRDAMWRVIEDDDWWHRLRRGTVEVARSFTWDRCAERTLAVYRRMLGRERGE